MDYKEQKLAVYPSCKATAMYNCVTIGEIYDKVRNDKELERRTDAYRNALAAGLSQKRLKEMKAEDFPMLMPAALCKNGRTLESVRELTCFCQADFDHIDPDRLDEARRRIRELKFVVMYHVSMSGNGLHVYYTYQIPNCGLNGKVYEQAFRQGNELIANTIPANYDTGVESPTHGSSLCHDPEAWLNPDVEPLKVDMDIDTKKRTKGDRIANDEAVTEDKWPSCWTAERVFGMAQGMVDKSRTGEFAHGNRNNYLVALACLLSDYGMKEETAAQLMEQEYAGQYGEESIPSLVRGCYKTVKKMHGSKALPDDKRSGERSKDVKMQLCAAFIRRQCLRFDSITHKIVKPNGTELCDRDINSMLLACNVESGQNISAQVFRSALMSDCIPEFNPLREYLKRSSETHPRPLTGEGSIAPSNSPGGGGNGGESVIDRVADMVHVTNSPLVNFPDNTISGPNTYLPSTHHPLSSCQFPIPREGSEVALTSLWRTCFKKWFVAMVASWLLDDVVNQQMLILIGKQGIYKSTWLDALVPPELVRYRCRQSATDFSDKDEQLRCTEFGMVNFDEFDRLSGRDLDNLKSLITTPDVNVRAPYGTTKERRVRIASYCASGNKMQFLTDQTGNRRFLPFYVESIDSPFEHKIPHRAMYDEAVRLIEGGKFEYWFSFDEIQQMSSYVEQFADHAPEEELIDVYFDVPRTAPDNPETRPVLFLTPSEIMAKLTTWGNIKKPISIRQLNIIMDKKGYSRVRHGHKGQRGYLVVELESATVNSNRIVATGQNVL